MEGETLYIGRCPHEGTVTIGKVCVKFGNDFLLFMIQFRGIEFFKNWDIVVLGSPKPCHLLYQVWILNLKYHEIPLFVVCFFVVVLHLLT